MNPVWGQVAGVVTIVTMLAFLSVCAWTWLPRHARKFERLSRLPMLDRDPP